MGPRPADFDCSVSAPGVRWYAPVGEGDRRTLGDWCRTVGPPVVVSLPVGEFGAWQDGESLAVVTWNVHGGSGDLLAFLERELHLFCGGEPRRGDAFSHFVILLQETYRRSADVPVLPPGATIPPRLRESATPGRRLDVTEVARRCGLALFYVPSMRNGHEEVDGEREDRGNAILSTVPLADCIAIELPFEAQRRVGAAATVRSAAGDSLRVVSLHLDVASSLARVLYTGNAAHARQGAGMLAALRQLEEERGDPGDARAAISTAIGGDFNTWAADETVLRDFARQLPDSPPRDAEPTRGQFPTDHLFFGQGHSTRVGIVAGSYRRADQRYDSDHHPRIVLLRLAL